MVHESGFQSWNCATFDPGCVQTVALEQDRANQECDRYPRDCVGNDDAIPEFATGQYTGVPHQRSAMLTFSRHGRLPGNVREVGGSRIAAASVFARDPAITRRYADCSRHTPDRRRSSRLNNDAAAICCRCMTIVVSVECRETNKWNLFRDFRLCMAASSLTQLINQAYRD
jgi:hypothetical protein